MITFKQFCEANIRISHHNLGNSLYDTFCENPRIMNDFCILIIDFVKPLLIQDVADIVGHLKNWLTDADLYVNLKINQEAAEDIETFIGNLDNYDEVGYSEETRFWSAQRCAIDAIIASLDLLLATSIQDMDTFANESLREAASAWAYSDAYDQNSHVYKEAFAIALNHISNSITILLNPIYLLSNEKTEIKNKVEEFVNKQDIEAEDVLGLIVILQDQKGIIGNLLQFLQVMTGNNQTDLASISKTIANNARIANNFKGWLIHYIL